MRRRLKPLSARITLVLFLYLVRSSFVVGSSFILFILILNNLITITEFIKFILRFSFDHFPFDSDGRCCRCLLWTEVSPSLILTHFPIVVAALFLFYSN